MKSIGRRWRIDLVAALVVYSGTATADDGSAVAMAAIPAGALFLGLSAAVFACLAYRRRALAAETSVRRLKDAAALQDAVSA